MIYSGFYAVIMNGTGAYNTMRGNLSKNMTGAWYDIKRVLWRRKGFMHIDSTHDGLRYIMLYGLFLGMGMGMVRVSSTSLI